MNDCIMQIVLMTIAFHNMPLYKLNNGKEKVSGWNEAEESHPLAYIKRKERENACLNSS